MRVLVLLCNWDWPSGQQNTDPPPEGQTSKGGKEGKLKSRGKIKVSWLTDADSYLYMLIPLILQNNFQSFSRGGNLIC